MGTSRRTRVGFGLAAGLVIAGTVGVTSMTASGESEIPAPTITIALQERSGTITYQPTVGDAVVQDILTAEPCAKIATTGPELLTFVPTASNSPTVQLPRGGLGVSAGQNCGDPAGFVSNHQSLTVALGSFFIGESGFTTEIVGAELKILRSGGSILKATYAGGDADPAVQTFQATTNPYVADVGEQGTFTSIKLEPQGGNPAPQRGVSLRGAVFTLDDASPYFYDEVDCGQTVPALVNGDVATSATFKRLENGKGANPDDCELIGVNLEIRPTDGLVPSHVFWDNSTGENDTEDVRALVTVNWAGIPSDEPGLLQTFINYEGIASDDESLYDPVEWCVSFDPIEQVGVAPDGVPWCLVSNTEVLDGGFIFQTQVFYGAGDPVGMKFG